MTMFDLLHQNAVSDTDLLRKNDELGDIFTMAREVDFAFETDDKARADDLAEFVNGKSYGTAAVSKLPNGRFRVLVLITMPITQHLVGCVSIHAVHKQTVQDRLLGLGVGYSKAVRPARFAVPHTRQIVKNRDYTQNPQWAQFPVSPVMIYFSHNARK